MIKFRGSFVFFLLVTEISFVMWIIFRYGEIVDVNLVRDKGTGKSKGFAFIAYEDQRSTNLAVGWFSSLSSLSLPCSGCACAAIG